MHVKIFTLIAVMSFSGFTFGADSLITKITRVGTTNSGDGIIIETETKPNSTCTSGAKTFMKKSENLLFSENLSILLSAFHSGASVRMYTENCIDGHIAFKSVSLVK